MYKEFDIKPSYKCNNACVFCLNKEKKTYQNLPLEKLKQHISSFIRAADETKETKLIFSGGEPLIFKDLFELLSFAKNAGTGSIEIQTNGRMLYYENMVKKLKKFEPIGFLVSLQFPNAELYKKYSQADGFYQTVGGIKNLVKHNCGFTINTVVMKPNLPYLKNMVKFIKKLGARGCQYRFIDGKNVMEDYKKFVPRYSECLPFLKEIIRENPDMRIFLREFPVCVIGKELKNYLAPSLSPGRLNLTAQNETIVTKKIEAAHFVFPNCKKCLWKNKCGGVRKEYVKIYGIKEFKPITEK